jgi:hypothetical protein
MVDGLNECARLSELSLKATIFLESVPVGEDAIERTWRRIQSTIRSEQSVLIYHGPNHFTLLAGFYEEPLTFDHHGRYSFADRRDWLVVAEHSTSDGLLPIRLVNWLEIREDVRTHTNHRIIELKVVQDAKEEERPVP